MLQKLSDKLIGAQRSITVWFNAMLLLALPFTGDIIAQLPTLQQFLPETIYKSVGTLAVVANLILRFRTKVPLELK